jgi:phosphomannomutase
MDAKSHNYGFLTTPGLSFLTLCNQYAYKHNRKTFQFVKIDEYFKFLSHGYKAFISFYDQFFKKNLKGDDKYQKSITVDCANGVSSLFTNQINDIFKGHLDITFINTDYNDHKTLNSNCGAEFLHKDRKLPTNYPEAPIQKNLSFDGDVDRIIY